MKYIPILFLALFLGCKTEQSTQALFQLVDENESGFSFNNTIQQTEDFNIFSYRNFYNGGGVSIGDINNDGLADVFLTKNMGSNELMLNKGGFKFESITKSAGVEGKRAWSTGVVMVDINHDGWLDIYVCNAGYVKGDDQANELFINNGDLTFTESAAEYGLNESGYTTHAAFFDYDLDGDLDAYLLNNSFIPVNTLNYANKRDLDAQDWPVKDFLKGGGDKLLRNDDGQFVNVNEEAGIYSSLIGFGLGITVGDVNGDHWPDMYISNDFFERDYLYVNQQDGTFKEDIKNWMEHLSLSSMGADMADINNDGFPEIFVTEMLPDNDQRVKTTTSFENYNVYSLKLERDFYHQYMHNTLQLNNKNNSFSEIAYYSGVAASDWSWGALMFDMDNDGYRDIYVCNGVYHDVTNQDFIDFFANEVVQKMALTGKKEEMQNIIDKMPSHPLPNKAFQNNKDLTFQDIGNNWGFDTPSFSNGAAYGDLDNDGDLDLVINNLNQPSFLYRNNASEILKNHFVGVELRGKGKNTFAVGAKVKAYIGTEIYNFQQIPSRGFQSSSDYRMILGLGDAQKIDSMKLIWPDQSESTWQDLDVDTVYRFNQSELLENSSPILANNQEANLLQEMPISILPHQEDDFIDFYQEGLTYKLISREGPVAISGDVNGDGVMDVFMGGGQNQPGQIYEYSKGDFRDLYSDNFSREKDFEDTAAAFFDADNDGDLDIYIGSGGNHRLMGDRQLQDRIYLNDGTGKFTLNPRALPPNGLNTSDVVTYDFEGDGDLDLIVSSRSVPGNYGLNPRSYCYENDGTGHFKDITDSFAPEFFKLGMLTDLEVVQLFGDDQPEIICTGEWMSPMVFGIMDGKMQPIETNLDQYKGWWYAMASSDLDNDGDMDLILGNRGENFYFNADFDHPAKLWLGDFDQNRTVDKIVTRTINGKDMPLVMKRELTNQIVSLKKQNLKHEDYANKSIQELFSGEALKRTLVKEANYFQSAVAINNDGQFELIPLPSEVQFSCICGIYCKDINQDGFADLLLGGNDNGFTPQFSKLDASFGHVLINQKDGTFQKVTEQQGGFFLRGDVKQLIGIDLEQETYVLAAINNRPPRLFKLK